MKNKPFWHWAVDEANEGEPVERTLYLEGVIASESWYEDDVTPQAFKEELLSGSGPITLAVNSPGGDCVAASMIYTMLKEYPGNITVRIEGLAASAASVISMAGDHVAMSPTALLMIHNPSTIAFGESADMDKAIRLLDETKESIINAYAIKTGLSRTKLSHMMDDETWLNAVKAKELGFCDEILYTGEAAMEQSDEDKPAFIFSQRQANLVLVNRMKAKDQQSEPEPPAEPELPTTQTDPEPPAPVPSPTQSESRVKAADRMKRLTLLSYQGVVR